MGSLRCRYRSCPQTACTGRRRSRALSHGRRRGGAPAASDITALTPCLDPPAPRCVPGVGAPACLSWRNLLRRDARRHAPLQSRTQRIARAGRLGRGLPRASAARARFGHRLPCTKSTAVRRGILEDGGSEFSLVARNISDYPREVLKDQFLASLNGSNWTERSESIPRFARWLGFRRTGPNIEDAARSVINSLIRGDRLEKMGSQIRRL